MRLRLRREISKDIERTRREILVGSPRGRRQPRSRDRRGETIAVGDALLQGVEMVRRQFLSKLEGLGVKPIESWRRPVRSLAP